MTSSPKPSSGLIVVSVPVGKPRATWAMLWEAACEVFAPPWFRVGTSLLAVVYALPSTRVNPWAVFLSSLLLCLLRPPYLAQLFPTCSAFRPLHIRISLLHRRDGLDDRFRLTSPGRCASRSGVMSGSFRSNSSYHTRGLAAQPNRLAALEALTVFCHLERQGRSRTKVGPSQSET